MGKSSVDEMVALKADLWAGEMVVDSDDLWAGEMVDLSASFDVQYGGGTAKTKRQTEDKRDLNSS